MPTTDTEGDVVLFELDAESGVGTITINRPAAMNSLNVAVFSRLQEIALAARYEKALKVLVLTAAGDRAFSAGNDVKGGSFTSAAAGSVSRRLQVSCSCCFRS